MLPNLYPLGNPCMINHVQRGRRRVNESHVIGFHVSDVDIRLRESAAPRVSIEIQRAEEANGGNLVSISLYRETESTGKIHIFFKKRLTCV